MIDDPVLINERHVAARSKDLGENQVLASKVLGGALVLWRTEGKVVLRKDLCIHRGAKLSLGKVIDGCLQCPQPFTFPPNQIGTIELPNNY